MIATLLALNLVFYMGNLGDKESQYFPGTYYNETTREQLHRKVLTKWPAVNTLLEVSQNRKNLSPRRRVTLLLGGAAFHNPLLLPAYISAISHSEMRVRQAAAFGYRDLIADRFPDVSSGITAPERRGLEGEMRAVLATLRANTLTEMWAASLLSNENILLPGYRGLVFKRRPIDCLNSLDVLVQAEDLQLLATTYNLSQHLGTRLNLLRLIEGLSLQRFMEIPQGEHAKWGPRDYEEGFAALDSWLHSSEVRKCGLQPETVLTNSFTQMGAAGIDPLSKRSCGVWLGILDKGDPKWWGLATRRLYECGSPPANIPILKTANEVEMKRRNAILKWNGVK